MFDCLLIFFDILVYVLELFEMLLISIQYSNWYLFLEVMFCFGCFMWYESIDGCGFRTSARKQEDVGQVY